MPFAVHNHFPGLKRLLSAHGRRIPVPDSLHQPQPGAEDAAALFLMARRLTNEIRSLVIRAAAEGREKKDTCRLLADLLSRTGRFGSHAYRIAINNFIVREIETYCFFHLDTEDLISLWKEVG
ncbi:MAG: hypothetical protein P4L51_29065 [Puia sp.]|nr:hypothetical protein [Puia sp.]